MKALLSVTLAMVILVMTAAFIPPAPVKGPSSQITSNNLALFQRVNVHRIKDGVQVAWVMTSENGVAGYVVQRSYDGEYFENIDEVLPAPARGVWNKCNDIGVYPGYLHYRILAVMENGTVLESDIQTIRIVQRK